MASARGTVLLVALGGVVPVLAGVLLLVLAPSPYGSFGWFAYAPLQAATPARSVVVLGPQQCLGAVVIAVGVVVFVAVAGYRLGRTRDTTS